MSSNLKSDSITPKPKSVAIRPTDKIRLSNPRTEKLAKINTLLNRGCTFRTPVSSNIIKSIRHELENIGIDKEKLSVLDYIPNNINVCVCQLASCCSSKMTCDHCEIICRLPNVNPTMWLKKDQKEQVYFSVIKGGQKINDMTQLNNNESDDTIVAIPSITTCAEKKKKQFPKCRNGTNCTFHQKNRCKYVH